jgi:hypothetical protein
MHVMHYSNPSEACQIIYNHVIWITTCAVLSFNNQTLDLHYLFLLIIRLYLLKEYFFIVFDFFSSIPYLKCNGSKLKTYSHTQKFADSINQLITFLNRQMYYLNIPLLTFQDQQPEKVRQNQKYLYTKNYKSAIIYRNCLYLLTFQVSFPPQPSKPITNR